MEGVEVGNPVGLAKKWAMAKQEGFGAWLGQQSFAVEAAITAGLAAVQGGVMGALMSSLNKDLAASLKSQGGAAAVESGAAKFLLPPEASIGGPLIQARNFAVLTGANAGIHCIIKKVRGVDDVQNNMAAAFGSGFLFSLVSSSSGPNIPGAVGTGALFALLQGGVYKLGQMMPKESGSSKEEDDPFYAKGCGMLRTLGLERYEKNLKKGSLTDASLPFLTDSDLKEASIPTGPRLIILDHIHRKSELAKGSS
ncbi:chloroplastic import inner membrane translocase subunit HP30-2-like [Wolffia australiana]